MYPKLVLNVTLMIILGLIGPLLITPAWANSSSGSMSIQPEVVLTNFFAIMISLTVHEFAHAWAAHTMGDPTPARYNRLNLNPITIIKAHPFGALIVPLIGSINGFLIGWAATPVNPHLVKRKYTLRQAERWISIAGPISNVILAILATLIYVAMIKFVSKSSLELIKPVVSLSWTLITTNIFLALFNMIPVPPLDGFSVMQSSLPKSLSHIAEVINQYSNMIIVFVFFFGAELLIPVVFFTHKMLVIGGLALLSIF